MVILFIFLFTAAAFSQRISIEAKLDTSVILIGDQVRFTLELVADKGIEAVFPQVPDTIKGIEILDTSVIDTSFSEKGEQIFKKYYTFTSFDSGMHRIPGYPFIVRWKDGFDTLVSRETFLSVFTVNVDTATVIKDIKPPLGAPVTFRELLPYILISLLLLALAAGVYYYIRVRRNKLPLFGLPKPKEPAHRIALNQLDLLKEERLWQKNEYKLYFSRLTDILRTYFDNRYSMNSMEQVTDEILAEFRRMHLLDSITFDRMALLLSTADLVKFAKHIPLADECDQAMQTVYHIVLTTKQDEVLDETAQHLPGKESQS